MSFVDERIAIDKQLSDSWTTTPIYRKDVPHATPTVSHVVIDMARGEGFQASLEANPLERYLGLITIHVLTPEGTGPRLAETYADTIAGLFKIKQFSYGSSGTITTRVPSIQSVGVEDGWYRTDVIIDYKRDKS
jgi:hypothetical protein